MTGNSDCVQSTDSKDSTRTLTVANGNPILVQLSGSSSFSVHNISVRLNDILLAPSITKNLLSVSRFCADNSISIRFDEFNVYLKDLQTQQPEVIIGEVKDSLYQIHLNKNEVCEVNHCSIVDLATWHRRLGHACESTVRKVIANHGLSSTFKKFNCERVLCLNTIISLILHHTKNLCFH